MDVHYFCVVSAGAGWAICEGEEQRSTIYGSCCEAVDSARHLAIDHWRRTGEPTSVRIFRALSASESIGSEWLEDIGFGMDYGAGKSTG